MTSDTMSPEIQAMMAQVADMAAAGALATQRTSANVQAGAGTVPTVRAFVPVHLENQEKGTQRTYRSPLTRLCEFQPCHPLDPRATIPEVGVGPDCLRLGCQPSTSDGDAEHRRLGDLRLDEVRGGDVLRFATSLRDDEILRKRRQLQRDKADLIREDRGEVVELDGIHVTVPPGTGVHGQIGALTAASSLFEAATTDYLVHSPTAKLKKPRKPKTKRRAFTVDELAQVIRVAVDTSTDPDLDALLIWFHLETGARQGEGLGARISDINVEQQTIMLGEKNNHQEMQPISMSLVIALIEFAVARGADERDDRIFRNRFFRPTSKKRYEVIWSNVRGELKFAHETNAATHCLRKTGATLIRKHAGMAVAEAWLRHTAESTDLIYSRATAGEVATAVADLTGEPHPLADRAPLARTEALLHAARTKARSADLVPTEGGLALSS
jgi:integrase